MNLEKSFAKLEIENIDEAGDVNNELGIEKEKSVAEKEAVLSDYCEMTNNPINFVRHGEESAQDLQLDSVWLQVGESERKILEEFLQRAELFLRSPIFTDSFRKDHDRRRVWDTKYIDNNLESDIAEYYRRNRFNINHLSLPFNFKSYLELDDIKKTIDEDIKAKTQSIIDSLKHNFPSHLHDYSNLSDEEKLEVIEKIEPVFQELLDLLSVNKK